jgi:hypothetical protein
VTKSKRVKLARWANNGVAGLPRLCAQSSRQHLINWLCANDRNGSYSDADARAEGLKPLSLHGAWNCLRHVKVYQDGH